MIRIGGWDAAVLIGVGVATLALTIVTDRDNRRTLEGDRRDLVGLGAQLDSVRALASAAAGPAERTRLAAEVTQREWLFGRRAYHIPLRAESVATYWTLQGGGVKGLVIGSLLLAFGVWASYRARRAPAPATAAATAPPPAPPGG